MLNSVRTRLTAWYTAVLTLILLVLVFATYGILAKNVVREADDSLVNLADTFLTTVHAEINDKPGPDAIVYAVQTARVEHNVPGVTYSVFDNAGRPVAISQRSASYALSEQSIADAVRSHHLQRSLGPCDLSSTTRVDKMYRGCAQHFRINGAAYELVVIESLKREEEFLRDVRETFAWTIPLAILIAGAGGYFLARRSLSPVVAMSAKAGHIGAANLHERLAVPNEADELGKLAISFNGLLDRLAQSFEQQKRFVADASHELRTPVAILCGEAEVSLSRVRSPEEYRESLTVLLAESMRLRRLVEDLFTLARADAGQYPLSYSEFYLDDLLAESCHAVRTLALAKQISLRCAASQDLRTRGDEILLRRMILNLLDNAIKYTPNGGSVEVSCTKHDSRYRLSVTDTGCGIPVERQPHIFERFSRAEPSRSRAEPDGGAGLGLCISRWIAEMHQGSLELTSSRAGSSTFTVLLPVPLDLACDSPR